MQCWRCQYWCPNLDKWVRSPFLSPHTVCTMVYAVCGMRVVVCTVHAHKSFGQMKKWKKQQQQKKKNRMEKCSITFMALTLPRFVRVCHICNAASGGDDATAIWRRRAHVTIASHQTWTACNSICTRRAYLLMRNIMIVCMCVRVSVHSVSFAPHRPPFFNCLEASECKRNPYNNYNHLAASKWNRSPEFIVRMKQKKNNDKNLLRSLVHLFKSK